MRKKHDEQKQAGVAHPQLESCRKGKCGQKRMNIQELRERLRDIPLSDRTTQRRLASALGIPSSRLHDNLEKLGLRAHSNALKPYLTDEGKRERVVWVLRWVRTTAAAGGYRVLHDFEDFVHVDEKWFYLFQDGQKFYLLRRRATPCPQGTEQAIHHEGHVYRCCCSPASQPSHELRLRR